jgi:hypothetical protein
MAMTFHGARFGLWGEKIGSWEHESANFRGLYPAFQAEGLRADISEWPPCELEFPKPFDDVTLSWVPMDSAAMAFFSVAGLGMLAQCALVTGHAKDHLALKGMHQVITTAWQATDVDISKDLLDYRERPAILLVSWALQYPDQGKTINSLAHCLAAKFFEEQGVAVV